MDSSIDASLLRYQLQLRRRNVEKERLESQVQQLQKLKASTASISEKIADVERNKLAQRAHSQIQRHRLVWQEENLRLSKWRLYLESELQNCVSSVLQITNEDPAEIIDTFETIADSEMSQNQYIETERQEIYNTVVEVKAVIEDINRQKQKNEQNYKPNQSMHIKLHQLLESLQRRFDKDESQILELKKDIANLCGDALVLDQTHIQNPWIYIDGNIQRFSTIKSVDALLTERCQLDYQNLVDWYYNHLHQLSLTYAQVIQHKYGGWTSSEHSRYEKINEEYPCDMRGRSALFYDRLILEFPKLSLHKLKEHEMWTIKLTAFKNHKRSIEIAFEARMKEIIALTVNQFMEAKQIYQEQSAILEQKEANLQKSAAIQNRICKWRNARIQQLKIAAAKRHAEMEAQLELNRIKFEREGYRRESDKAKLQEFFDKKQRIKEKEMEVSKKAQQRLNAQKAVLQQINEERIEFRENQRIQRLEDKKMSALQVKARQDALERQLDRLRATVAVDIQSDWNRIMGDTIAFAESKKDLKQPEWFKNNSFTIDQIMKDKRAQISQVLHSQGLLSSKYASQVLTAIQPKHTRPDQATTIKLG
ncbi:hypothetical protein QVD99_002473 [Batrachochytrium dendrobatidis]|nr:hypothetical protein O5D80_006701 [Batrachochytrium dendrobatidis]KAK5670696.1 hypothetical protein QVD99_002473 [Batrachochytrium dendrobatidis]